ncbi:hypothetical protein [Vibrio owensii]|uniref:hypothetical protein n=1 Tax=Vibrio harveyi group TaxID=717610 RepID=UPI003CC5FD51
MKIKKYNPLPYRQGNTIQKIYDEDFVDAVGNQAIVTKCDFTDKKGVLHEGYSLRVKWLEEQCMSAIEKKKFLDSFYKYEDEDLDWYDGPLAYFFTHNGALFYAFIGDGFNDFFVAEIDTEHRSELANVRNFEERADLLFDKSKSFYRVTFKRYLREEAVVEGTKARLAFERFVKSVEVYLEGNRV